MAAIIISIFLCLASVSAAFAYDPLSASGTNVTTLELTVEDAKRQRSIPILVYLPASNVPQPVVLFSHGLGGSRYGSSFLGKHWAGHQYVAIFIQHPGSDESVWKDKSLLNKITSIKRAANKENFTLRADDVPAVLDQLELWNAQENHPLYGLVDMSRIGMSGHSFGAVTTQAVSGQRFAGNNISITDLRIKAAIAFSPSKPREDQSPQQAFGSVSIPWLLMTGTEDNAPFGNTDPESRLGVYPALPPGDKYELVLYGAEHSAFTERKSRNSKDAINPNHHRVILGISTAYWDSYLRGDTAASVWLKGSGPSSIMEQKDRWQYK